MPRKRTFGNVYESRGRWRVRYSIAGRRYDVAGGATQAEAEAVLARLTYEQARERLEGRPAGQPVTLAEFVPRLWSVWEAQLRPATITTRRKALRHYAAVLTGPMRDLSVVEAEAALLRRLRAGLRPSSVHADRRVLSSAWSTAQRMELVHRNPWKGVRLPPIEKEPHLRLAATELERLYAAAPADLVLPVLLMGEAGLRRGEVLALEWRDVAPAGGAVTIRAAVAKSRRFRHVPTTPRLAEQLRAAGPALPSARVCPITASRLNHGFRDVANGVGLRELTPHGLRHAYAHRLAEAGGCRSTCCATSWGTAA